MVDKYTILFPQTMCMRVTRACEHVHAGVCVRVCVGECMCVCECIGVCVHMNINLIKS